MPLAGSDPDAFVLTAERLEIGANGVTRSLLPYETMFIHLLQD
jgi:hypothetical protein